MPIIYVESLGAWRENYKENPGAYMRAVLSLVPKNFALTPEKDETPQCIEIRFVDEIAN